jgi:LacI family transcriptional regulator
LGNKIQNNRETMRGVAEKVGVSTTTVSRVLNGKAEKYRISKRTQEDVLRIASELGYVPDQVARGLRIRRTNTVGLIIPDISNPFFSTIARNIEINARKVRYSIILSDCQEETQLEKESIRLLQSRKVDGLLICPVGEDSEHLISLANSGLPIVIIDRYFPDVNCSYVISDNYKGALEAVTYLINNNHRSIACIQGRLNTSVNENRVRGYRDALHKFNIPLDESLIVGDNFGEKNGYIGAKIILNRKLRPTAIFSTSNLISLGAMKAILEEGLKIPEDVSMVSFDDQPYSDYLVAPMTTVAQRISEIGQIAFTLLQSQIKQENNQRVEGIVLPTELIIRKSVKKLDDAGSTLHLNIMK